MTDLDKAIVCVLHAATGMHRGAYVTRGAYGIAAMQIQTAAADIGLTLTGDNFTEPMNWQRVEDHLIQAASALSAARRYSVFTDLAPDAAEALIASARHHLSEAHAALTVTIARTEAA